MKLWHCQIVCVHATGFLYSHELKYVNIEVREIRQNKRYSETNCYLHVVLVQALQKSWHNVTNTNVCSFRYWRSDVCGLARQIAIVFILLFLVYKPYQHFFVEANLQVFFSFE